MKKTLKVIRETLKKIGFSPSITQQGGVVNLALEDPGLLIGRDGQGIYFLGLIIKKIIFKQFKAEDIKNFSLDINEYRQRKLSFLKRLAKDSAYKVSITKKELALKPMGPYERRVVHLELSGRKDVVTTSQGQGEERRIVISPN